MTSDSWIQLEAFVTAHVGKPLVGESKLSTDTDLYHDLDMNPDKIAQFIAEWSTRFNVNLDGFDLHHYFPADKLNIGSFLATVARSPFSSRARQTLGGRSLTLGMLEEAMNAGRWER